jgi:poly-gamma-glutamate capsule biosynthesis protein CapA/YwtB (metallophosphatase superfamily)
MSELKMVFTGDFCPQLRVHDLIVNDRYDLIFNDFKKEFENSDFNIVDLECPLTNRITTIPKTGPHLKAIPQSVNALKYAGVNAVAMANNHIKDYGEQAIVETMRHCEDAGICTVGVGQGLEKASQALRLNLKGVKIAVINITENEWSNTYGAETGANPLDLVKNFNTIKNEANQNDFVIVVFHGGNEFYELPSPRLKETFRFFIDAGASAVIAHHTHIVSGFEVYKDAPIFYSLGNFCFDWPDKRNSFWNLGFAVRLKLRVARSIEFDIIPFKQNDSEAGVHLLSEDERASFEEKIKKLNAIISDDNLLQSKFQEYCKEKESIYQIYFEPYSNRLLASLHKRGWFPSLLTSQKKRLYSNIIRCESHRDILMHLLNKQRE